MKVIKVLVVDDSVLFRNVLVQCLNADSSIQVVAQAGDPYEARDAIIKYRPDVMTLDVEMPRMNGIEFLRKLMPQYPLPVVMISALDGKVFDALEAGAVDFVNKPTLVTYDGVLMSIIKFNEGCEYINKRNIAKSDCIIEVDTNHYEKPNQIGQDRVLMAIDGNTNEIVTDPSFFKN